MQSELTYGNDRLDVLLILGIYLGSVISESSVGAADDEKHPEDSSDEEMEEEGTARQEERRRSHGEAGPASGGPDAKFYAETPDGTRFSAGAFSDLHLSRPLLKACAALGYTDPTPIQVPSISLEFCLRGCLMSCQYVALVVGTPSLSCSVENM